MVAAELALSPLPPPIVQPVANDEECDALEVESSYDGSHAVFRLLRMETWGPALMNLGIYRFRGPLSFLNVAANMELAQRRLVMKAIDLLDVQPCDRVLDIACGRGKSSFIVHCLHPQASVVGIDLLPAHVQVARTLFHERENLSYRRGNAQELDFEDGSFDRAMCIEAAFHFPDRARFLANARRVLRPGGRLVVVDFAWKSEAARGHLNDPQTRHVRDVWQWHDLYTVDEYRHVAQACGFRVCGSEDWSSRVTAPIQRVFRFLSWLGNCRWGQRLLTSTNPLYRSFSEEDWREIAFSLRAHDHVQSLSRYMAFVLEAI